MIKLIDSIVNKNFVAADSILEETVELIMTKKLEEAKKQTAAKMCEEPHSMNRTASKLRAMDIAELDVSKEKPGDIEDKRGERAVNTSMKTNFGGNQEVASGKTDLPKKQTVNATEKGDLKEKVESGEESSMARSELNAVTKDAKSIMSKVKGNKELEAWTQSKITKAADYLNSVADYMGGEEKLEEARINIVKARIRGGQIQRRKKISNVPGMTLRGGKLQRMSAAERRRRKMGARKAVRKRAPKMNRALMKRQRSLRKRKALGI
jgi:hypothetical protein